MLLAADGGEEVLLGTAVSALAAPTTSIVSGETGQLRLALVGEGDPGLEEWTTRRGSRPLFRLTGRMASMAAESIGGEDGVDGRLKGAAARQVVPIPPDWATCTAKASGRARHADHG